MIRSILLFCLLLKIVFVFGQDVTELEKRNGFKDIKLGMIADSVKGVKFKKDFKEDDQYDARLYEVEHPDYNRIGEVEIKKIELKAYKNLVYEIKVITPKDTRIMKAESLNDATIADPIATPEESTVYNVTATSTAGCPGVAEITITVEGIVGFPAGFSPNGDGQNDFWNVNGFSLGAESIALFARVGGGIYTKAADVGADLVGKVEAGIPEDDVRNPATIADNVGDNVGDVAGMGADLFGSYVATILATMVLGQEIKSDDQFGGLSPILLPMLIAGLGLIFSIVGTWFVRITKETDSVQNALNIGNWSSIVFTAIASYFAVDYLLPETMEHRGVTFTSLDVYLAIIVGLVVGTLMSIITEYYTAMGKRPVLSIIKQSGTGHATNIIGGLSVGMESTVLPIIVLAGGIIGSYAAAGLYGVAIAAAGMMATTAMQLAIDAFGPIADNAGGIAEMSQLPEEVRHRTDNLDAVGNTTAATGKGFAIASAALTSLALFAAFVGVSGITAIDIYKAPVLAGLFVGGMIPFIFSSLAIAAVGRAAMDMVNEVRRQFREIPGIMEYKAKPEYEKCVAISTKASIREMIAPGAIAILVPIIVGFIFGPEVLGGLLAGVTVSGVLMGMFQSNAGGAWDNAKKSFEKGVEINGQKYFKKSEPHKASVTGDTVGDPFKDTSGPSMNILIKLTSIVALIIAPHISEKDHTPSESRLVKPVIENVTATVEKN